MKNSFVGTTESFLRHHYSKLLVLFFGVFAPLIVFGHFAEDVIEQEVFFFDRPILMFMHSHATQVLDMVMVFITRVGSSLVLIPLNILGFWLLIYRRRRRDALFWALAVVGASVINFIAKHAFARVRPDLWTSISPEVTYSFPSGHAMNSMAVMTALVVLAWNTRWRNLMMVAGVCFILLVGSSRIYLGVHYPSDILAGWAASFAWVVGLASVFTDKWHKRVPS
jgi:membrane-associated phospholipid phosphatase